VLDELEDLALAGGERAHVQRVAELRAMLENVEEGAGSLCLRANEHMDQGQLDRALELFEQATSRYPDYAWGWADMGICLLEMNRYADAERALVRAVDLGADDVATRAPLGAARMLQDDIEGAWECLNVCIGIDPADPGTRRLAAMIHDTLQEVANEPDAPADMPAVLEELRRIAGP
jgi:tetratricopeptide (TPR) repeat protein